jgi:plastocyanin
MRTISLGLVALVASLALAAALGFANGAQAATPTLVAQTGPGFTITLKKSGKLVKVLKPGKYIIKVLDKSSIHNFHLTGPGVNKKTSTPKIYTIKWTVTLKKGKYNYICDPHAEFMRNSFVVK